VWKEGSKNFFLIVKVREKKVVARIYFFIVKVLEMMPCGTLKFQIAFWALKPTSTKYHRLVVKIFWVPWAIAISTRLALELSKVSLKKYSKAPPT